MCTSYLCEFGNDVFLLKVNFATSLLVLLLTSVRLRTSDLPNPRPGSHLMALRSWNDVVVNVDDESGWINKI